ncbi:MAG: 30S ribosomal protein S3ae [Thermoprotei archaeon]|nr:MAG: 30S ribosomal protein S3ae [Thermoprotei archaeon]
MSKAVIKDKWKLKKWFTVLAPSMFGSVPIGTTPADKEWKLLGRVFEVTLFDLTGDFSQHHIHLYFQVYDVKDNTAYTRFKGHELARDYIKSIIRRKSSKIQAIVNVTTKDGYGLRVTGIVLTTFRCKTSQKKAIRKIMMRILTERASNMTLEEYVKAMIFGKLALEIMEQAKKIYPIRKVEIYKSKLLTIPTPEGPKPAVIVPQPPR